MEKELLLYDTFCRQFSKPEEFTTTERLLKRICSDSCAEYPDKPINELIKINLPLVQTLFTLPNLPIAGNPRFQEWLDKH